MGDLKGACAGTKVLGLGDLDGDGIDELAVSAPGFNGAAGGSAGGVVLLDLPEATVFSLADATVGVQGAGAGNQLGQGLAAPGDINGDGYEDLLAGSPDTDVPADNAGSAWIFLGPFTGWVDTGSAQAEVLGTDLYEELGSQLAGAGDVNGDGWLDLLIGASAHEGSAGNKSGGTWLIYGPFSGVETADSLGPCIEGPGIGDKLGAGVSGGGDLDGDGLGDLVIGAPGDNTAATDAGAVWVLFGSVL